MSQFVDIPVKCGMRCRFFERYAGKMNENGIVISVNEDGTFTVCEDLPCPPQYNDSYTDFTENDIGKTIFFESQKQQLR